MAQLKSLAVSSGCRFWPTAATAGAFACICPLLLCWLLTRAASPAIDRQLEILCGCCSLFLATQLAHQGIQTGRPTVSGIRAHAATQDSPNKPAPEFMFAAVYYGVAACLYFLGAVGAPARPGGMHDVSNRPKLFLLWHFFLRADSSAAADTCAMANHHGDN